MRHAVLDIGTNAVKILVADVTDAAITPVFEEDRVTRLGENVHKTRRLSKTAIARTIDAIAHYVAESKKLGAENFLLLATSAARDAENRNELLDGIRCKLGLDCQILSGDREAELAFRGVATHPDFRGKSLCVIEVGGGSVQFTFGKDEKIAEKFSLDLGCVRMTEQFSLGGEQIADKNFQKLSEFLRDSMQNLKRNVEIVVGVGGTAVYLATTAQKMEKIERDCIDGYVFERETLQKFVRELKNLPLSTRKNLRGLPAGRADVIVAGGETLVAALDVMEKERLIVTLRSLRFGALLCDS
jgi:exopolyphosphatase/guanosine-5'-triphosphate,3'-diphosphate pyrophosphatase